MKILILKPSSLGDVVQALPVLRLLKRQNPSSQIYWWLAQDLLPLLAGEPELAGIFPFDRRRWTSPFRWNELWASVCQMRRHEFDWVIDLQGLARSAMVAWLADGRLTIGLDDPREGAQALYDIAVPRPSAQTHAVDWYLSVLPHLQAPVHWDFEWLPARPEVASAIRRKWQPATAPWIAIHPGARWLNKRWPVEHYAALVELLAAQDPTRQFALLGSRAESNLGARIARSVPGRCLDLTGQTSLPEMIEWIRLADLMVTNDTGPMHVAAALGKPVVALFGPTNPHRTGPYGQIPHVLQSALPCVPCAKDHCDAERFCECLRAIAPQTVAQEVQRRLLQSASGQDCPRSDKNEMRPDRGGGTIAA